MKKIFGFVALMVVALLPLCVAKASTGINYKCDQGEEIVTCTVTYDISTNPETNLTVKLTEEGGAKIEQSSITNAADSNWNVDGASPLNNVWTVNLASMEPNGITGTGNLFTFKYKKSGTTDCKVILSLGDKTVPITPPKTPDEAADNKQTGATLPYIALGTIAVVAVGAYIATRNKAKMYKI